MIVGVDTAMNRIDAVAMTDGRIADFFSMDIKKPVTRSQSLKDLRFSFNFWLRCLATEPFVFVESSIVMNGRQTAVALAETVGMILSLPFPVEKVPIDTWKQVAVGKGGVSKDKVREAILLAYPATGALFGTRQDLFDATGVAIYGHRLRRSSPATDPA